jgi:hypothetical protein
MLSSFVTSRIGARKDSDAGSGDGSGFGGGGGGVPDEAAEPPFECPEPTDLYISTKTKIASLDTAVELNDMFWFVPVIPYSRREEGIISKQIKISSGNEADQSRIMGLYRSMRERPEYENIYTTCVELEHIDTRQTTRKRYKHTIKVSCGISNKDITTLRVKERGMFFNCFSVVIRVLDDRDGRFKEVNIKMFNTGRLQMPGVKDEWLMFRALDRLIGVCNAYFESIGEAKTVAYDRAGITNDLTNSNFNCGFNIRQSALLSILQKQYNIIAMFDDCSYPGIQCKFYYNRGAAVQDGVCRCDKRCSTKRNSNPAKGSCIGVSFKIFRTGSVMILGKCPTDDILYDIYRFTTSLLRRHFAEIQEGPSTKVVKKSTRSKKRFILRSAEAVLRDG